MYAFDWNIISNNHHWKIFKFSLVVSRDQRWRDPHSQHLCPKLATTSTCITLPPIQTDWVTIQVDRRRPSECASCNPPPKVCESNRIGRDSIEPRTMIRPVIANPLEPMERWQQFQSFVIYIVKNELNMFLGLFLQSNSFVTHKIHAYIVGRLPHGFQELWEW